MRIYGAAMPEEPNKMNIVARKATIEKMAEERAENEEKKRKWRSQEKVCSERERPGRNTEFRRSAGVQVRGCVHEGSVLCGMFENECKTGKVETQVLQVLRERLLDLEWAMQQEERQGETAKVKMMEANENLIEEMASEERKVVDECRAEIGQRVRWADMVGEREGRRSEMEKERAERVQAVERGDRWSIEEELEEAEARRQREEELSMADREELCQERECDRVESTRTDGEEEGELILEEEEEWGPSRHVDVWVPSVDVSFASEAVKRRAQKERIGLAREAFEPREGAEAASNE